LEVCHAEVIGSLLRPQYLKAAREDWEAGRLPTPDFKRIEDRSVDEAIELQESAGIDVITDGEMRRFLFFDQLLASVGGLQEVEGGVRFRFTGEQPEDQYEYVTPVAVTEKLHPTRSPALEEFVYLRARARVPVKITLPSPLLTMSLWSKERSAAAYPDPFELFEDAAQIVHGWAKELVAIGCEYIQFDAPEFLQAYVDESIRAGMEEQGISTDRFITEGVDLLNAVADLPGTCCALHICKGNYMSKWLATGGYEGFARGVFRRATNFDVFHLEYDDGRSGSFEPLQTLPDDKVAVLGLVSTKHGRLEDVDALVKRISEASKYHPLEQLAISPQCGFATGIVGNSITEASQSAKLRLIGEVAQRVWG
jgi:5-methyltetrahydropteroyltriglutamate--homocysteine methyltransferase